MGVLIGLPSWAVGVFVMMLTVIWYLVEYAVNLRKQISDLTERNKALPTEGQHDVAVDCELPDASR